jgi:alkanesulfonate monooxygenase SsuD/methylene tetrahydromethanopterin reductase-like flavin-dependent oxidoreductase (luciferase family)
MLRLWALIASLLQRCNDMRIGFALPNIGPIGSPEAVATVATRAEALGYDSLWTIERLLYPVQPQTPYQGTPDGALPEPYKGVAQRFA